MHGQVIECLEVPADICTSVYANMPLPGHVPIPTHPVVLTEDAADPGRVITTVIANGRVYKTYDRLCGYCAFHTDSNKCPWHMAHAGPYRLQIAGSQCGMGPMYRRPNVSLICNTFTDLVVTVYEGDMHGRMTVKRHTPMPDDRSVDVIRPGMCATISYAKIAGQEATYSEISTDAGLKIIEQLQCIHSRGYVHGDVRHANIIVSGDDATLIDYDYTSPISESPRYPPGYHGNDVIPCRHCDARAGSSMHCLHDIWALCHILGVEQSVSLDELKNRLVSDAEARTDVHHSEISIQDGTRLRDL